jgi:hypothetical protein
MRCGFSFGFATSAGYQMSIHCQVKIALPVDGDGIRPPTSGPVSSYKRAEVDRSDGVKRLHQAPTYRVLGPLECQSSLF